MARARRSSVSVGLGMLKHLLAGLPSSDAASFSVSSRGFSRRLPFALAAGDGLWRKYPNKICVKQAGSGQRASIEAEAAMQGIGEIAALSGIIGSRQRIGVEESAARADADETLSFRALQD